MNKTVLVNIPAGSSKDYPIIIGEDILKNSGGFIKNHTKVGKVLIVSNKKVFSLYGDTVKTSLEAAGIITDIVLLEDGEIYKNIESLETIWDKAIQIKLERKDAIIALGGGVIGDISGFAAATYLRGIDFVQIPTTLLAQVDSSVGGKVAVNHSSGKNLIGAFYQPKLVISDILTLKTLTTEQLKVGLAEILKYAFIEKSCNLKGLNLGLIEYLQNNRDAIFNLDLAVVSEVVKYCCELKAAVVSQDEQEKGLRAILNFGHTVGHAIEKCTNYEYFDHGQAVALGVVGAFDIAYQMGLIEKGYFDLTLNLINQYGLNYKIPENVKIESLFDAMNLDKKVLSGKVRFVLPISNAQVEIFSDVDKSVILSILKKLY